MPKSSEDFLGFEIKLKCGVLAQHELFDLYRKYVIHQYELFNHRTNWYVAINAVLLGTYGLTIQKRFEVTSTRFDIDPMQLAALNWFLFLLAGFGVALSILTNRLLVAAGKPIEELFKRFNKQLIHFRQTNAADLDPALGRLPYVVGAFSPIPMQSGRKLTENFPILVGCAWALIAGFTVVIPEVMEGYPSVKSFWTKPPALNRAVAASIWRFSLYESTLAPMTHVNDTDNKLPKIAPPIAGTARSPTSVATKLNNEYREPPTAPDAGI